MAQNNNKTQNENDHKIAENYRKENNLNLKNIENPPLPYLQFQGLDFPAFITETIKANGYKEFTPIQAQGLPIIISGRDFIGISKTGSGKTLAFLIPAILHILKSDKNLRGPLILVLSPTRQLAMQIENEFKKFLSRSTITWACVYGGIKKQFQRGYVSRGVQILVATPGRLLDFIEENTVSLENVTYFVLDEADRMLDMGFSIQIREICSYLNKPKQSLMFSATWPFQIKQLAQRYLSNAVSLQIGILQRSINAEIRQEIKFLSYREKYEQLNKDLNITQQRRLVFVQKKIDCELLSEKLTAQGIRCASIHGDKAQVQRDKALMLFKTAKIRVLIATDVASRGLDIPDVQLVINYDFPKQIEDYIHRIGRTGRAGKKGLTVSYLSEGEDNRLGEDLIKVLRESGQIVPNDLIAFSKRKGGDKYEKYTKNRYNYQTKPSTGLDNWRNMNNTKANQNIGSTSDWKGSKINYDNGNSDWRTPKSMKNIEEDLKKNPKNEKPLKSEKLIQKNRLIYKQKIYHPSLTFECQDVAVTIRFYDATKVNSEAIIVSFLESDKENKLTRKMNKLFGISCNDILKGNPAGNIKVIESKKIKNVQKILLFNLTEQQDQDGSYLTYMLNKIFKLVQTQGYQSICLHELGLGKYNLELQARTIIYSIFEILSKTKCQTLQQILVIVENEKQMLEYARLYEKMVKNAQQNNILVIEK